VVKASPARGWKLWRWTGACHGSAASCSLRLKGRRFVTASFVPPGDRLNPYRLGTAAKLTQGWQMKVNSATLNADAEVEAVTDQYGNPVNSPPPVGAQYTLVNVSMTYVGGGSRSLPGYLQSGVWTVGAGKGGYDVYGCQPPPRDLNSDFTPVPSGQTVTGNLCFEIASNDAGTLRLGAYGTTGQAVWFALR
jgi:hypothetical protein